MMDENKLVPSDGSSSSPFDLRSSEDQTCFDIFQWKLKNGYQSTRACLKKHRRIVFSLLAGQLLSLLLCGTGSTSEALEQFYSITAPTTQLFFTYLTLSLVFGPMVICMNDFHTIVKQNWWKYVIIALIDVEANYLVVLAYKYTNLSSVQILDSFTLFTVLVLSYIFLKARYLIIHLMGVALAVIGIFSLVLVDFDSPHNEAGPNPLLGDLFCLLGAILYAISNVCQEYLVKNHSVFEWLGFLGTFGTIITAIQLCILERRNLASVSWSGTAIGTFALFVLCLVLFYVLMPVIIKYSNAVVVNLSLLTADVYTIIIGKYLFKQTFMFLYVVSFVIVVFGVFLFNLKPIPMAQPRIELHELRSRLRLRSRFRRRRRKDATPPNDQRPSSPTLKPQQQTTAASSREDSTLLHKDTASIVISNTLSKQPSDSTSPLSVGGDSSSSSRYGSNSRDGSEILRKVNSRDEITPTDRTETNSTDTTTDQ